MTEYRVPRTGRPALVFTGELLSEQRAEIIDKGDNVRAWTVRLYQTGSGKAVASVSYRSDWEEPDHDAADVLPDLAGAATWLADHDPAGAVVGYPTGAQFAERQARLLGRARQLYAGAVSAVLAEAGAEERVD